MPIRKSNSSLLKYDYIACLTRGIVISLKILGVTDCRRLSNMEKGHSKHLESADSFWIGALVRFMDFDRQAVRDGIFKCRWTNGFLCSWFRPEPALI